MSMIRHDPENSMVEADLLVEDWAPYFVIQWLDLNYGEFQSKKIRLTLEKIVENGDKLVYLDQLDVDIASRAGGS